MDPTDELLTLARAIVGYDDIRKMMLDMEEHGVDVPFSLWGQVNRNRRDRAVVWLGTMGTTTYTDDDLDRAVVEARAWVVEHAASEEEGVAG